MSMRSWRVGGSDEDGLHITNTTRDRVVGSHTSRRRNLECILETTRRLLGCSVLLALLLCRPTSIIHGAHLCRTDLGNVGKGWIGVEIGLLVRPGCPSDPGTLNLDPHHGTGELRHTTEEEIVMISVLIFSLRDAAEAVQVELSLEGWEFTLLEVDGHDVLDEVLWTMNDEATTVWLPRNDIFKPFVFRIVKHVMKLEGKVP
mmetsp:Transcript_25598/g.55999  ORF Transcript_25598/g.55999 Transcript_25598/m.55999 type:complete len:202 (+) Transcript_25598:514-1119(+)